MKNPIADQLGIIIKELKILQNIIIDEYNSKNSEIEKFSNLLNSNKIKVFSNLIDVKKTSKKEKKNKNESNIVIRKDSIKGTKYRGFVKKTKELNDEEFKYHWSDIFPQLGLNYTKENEALIIEACKSKTEMGGLCFRSTGAPHQHLEYEDYARFYFDLNDYLFSDKFLRYLVKKMNKNNLIKPEIYNRFAKLKFKYHSVE